MYCRVRTLTIFPLVAAALVACGGGSDGDGSFTPPPVGKFLYVPNVGSGNVSVFAVNATTGSLSAVAGSPFNAGVMPRGVTANRAGTSLYVVNEGSASAAPKLSAYSINANTGALTQVTGSPFDLSTPPPPTMQTPLSRPLLHPSGTLAYLSATGTGALFGATVDATSGSLTQITGMPLNLGLGLSPGTFNANGSILYLPHDLANGVPGGNVLAYSVHQSTGILTSIGPFATGGRVPASVTLNAQGTLMFVPNAGSGSLAVFRVDTTSGTLTPAAGSPFVEGGDTIPISIALHPSKNFVYMTNAFVFTAPDASTVSAFQVDPATGVLTRITGSPFTTSGAAATGARIDPSGKFLYVSNRFTDNIKAYAIDQTTGALTNVPGSPFATGDQPTTVQIDVSGRYLYVANAGSNNVSSYAIDAGTGALTLVNSVSAGTEPSGVEVVGLQ